MGPKIVTHNRMKPRSPTKPLYSNSFELCIMNPAEWISKNAPEPILAVLRPIYRRPRRQILNVADSMKLIGPSTIYDESYYAKRLDDPWRSDAHTVARTIRDYFHPSSVIDFGCAIGSHLEPFHEENIEIKGVEGNPAAFEYAVVPTDYLIVHDLREPYDSQGSYDIALCFEVAEHLPEEFADVLVDTLTEASDIVVMTAATPGQGGAHHINEQPPEYWHRKFESRGFEHDSEAVQTLNDRIEVNEATWILDNLMVFQSKADTQN